MKPLGHPTIKIRGHPSNPLAAAIAIVSKGSHRQSGLDQNQRKRSARSGVLIGEEVDCWER